VQHFFQKLAYRFSTLLVLQVATSAEVRDKSVTKIGVKT